MESKLLIIAIFISISSLLVFTEGEDPPVLTCISKLTPCLGYLEHKTPEPGVACCVPLKEMIDTQKPCLCAIYNNVTLLASLNVTQAQLVDVPNRCGTPFDVNKYCNQTNGNSTAPPPPSGSNDASGLSSLVGSSVVMFVAVGWLTLFVLVLKF